MGGRSVDSSSPDRTGSPRFADFLAKVEQGSEWSLAFAARNYADLAALLFEDAVLDRVLDGGQDLDGARETLLAARAARGGASPGLAGRMPIPFPVVLPERFRPPGIRKGCVLTLDLRLDRPAAAAAAMKRVLDGVEADEAFRASVAAALDAVREQYPGGNRIVVEAHRLPPGLPLEGPSAGLAVLLASHLALEHGIPVPPGLCATGAVDPWGRLGPVDHVAAKVRIAAGCGRRILLVPRSALEEARAEAPLGFELRGLPEEAAIQDLVDAIDRAIEDVVPGALQPTPGGLAARYYRVAGPRTLGRRRDFLDEMGFIVKIAERSAGDSPVFGNLAAACRLKRALNLNHQGRSREAARELDACAAELARLAEAGDLAALGRETWIEIDNLRAIAARDSFELDKAEEYARASLRRKQDLCAVPFSGVSNHDLAASLGTLGQVLTARARWEGDATRAAEAVAVLEQAAGFVESLDASRTRNYLAAALVVAGRHDEGIGRYLESWESERVTLVQSRAMSRAYAAFGLAYAYYDRHRRGDPRAGGGSSRADLNEAIAWAGRAIEDPWTPGDLVGLAHRYRGAALRERGAPGDIQAALADFDRAIECFGPPDPAIPAIMHALAACALLERELAEPGTVAGLRDPLAGRVALMGSCPGLASAFREFASPRPESFPTEAVVREVLWRFPD